MARFKNFADVHNFNENKKRQTMPFYLKDHALTWYNTQTPETKGGLALLTTALENRFNGSDGLDSDMALSWVKVQNFKFLTFEIQILKLAACHQIINNIKFKWLIILK